jgi:hypothetical protein
MKLTIDLTPQAHQLLDDLVKYGIYGRSIPEIAARFIDESLTRFIEKPVLYVRRGAKDAH